MVDTQFLARPAPLGTTEQHFGLLEKALALLGLLVLMGVHEAALPDHSDRTAGSALFQFLAGSIYLSAIGAMLIRGIPVWVFRMLARSWPLILLTLLALVSTLWSQAPDASLRRAIALILSSAFAVFFIARFNLRTNVALIVIAFAIYLALSLVAVAIPGYGIVPEGTYAGAMQGVAGHKNSFGRTVALATILLLVAAAFRLVRFRRTTLLLSFVAVAFLLLSRSATSLVAAFAGLTSGVLIYAAFGGKIGRMKLHPALGTMLLAIATVCVAFVLAYGVPTILALLGRDPTLTGRTELWDWAIEINKDRKLLGSGYRTFWIDENTKYFFLSFNWRKQEDTTAGFHGPSHAHSGYVDVYLELGMVGIACLALLFVSAFVLLRKAITSGAWQAGLLLSVITAFTMVYATGSNSILQQSEDLWFLFVLFYLLAVKESLLGSAGSSSPSGVPTAVTGTSLKNGHHRSDGRS